MLRQGIAIICRTREELDALHEVILKEGYSWRGRREREFNPYEYTRVPVRMSFNTDVEWEVCGKHCISRATNLQASLNAGITEVYEASDFLHNIIISRRLKGE